MVRWRLLDTWWLRASWSSTWLRRRCVSFSTPRRIEHYAMLHDSWPLLLALLLYTYVAHLFNTIFCIYISIYDDKYWCECKIWIYCTFILTVIEYNFCSCCDQYLMQRIIHSIAVQRGTFAASMVITNRPIGFMDPVSYNKEIGNFGM